MPNEFKYYALHYLDLWVSQDKPCCEALDGSDESMKLETLREAAKAYRIVRNLRTRYDEGKGLRRYAPVLKIIDALDRADFRGEKLLPSIKKVRNEIRAKYGRRDVLSATTKFLWLKMKSPIIIYDNQARKALRAAPGDIDEYYARWQQEFNRYEQQIRAACLSLPKVHEYAKRPEIATRQHIAKIAAKGWFRERVFDVYLWQRGLDGLDA
jgi:hypothetical protein